MSQGFQLFDCQGGCRKGQLGYGISLIFSIEYLSRFWLLSASKPKWNFDHWLKITLCISYQSFNRVPFNKMIWSRTNQFEPNQNNLDGPKSFWPYRRTSKEFCNRGRGLSAASLRRLQATPSLQTSLRTRHQCRKSSESFWK